MTLEFDPQKISQKVKDFVLETMRTEGSKKKIDSEKEFKMLGDYLNGNAGLNKVEKEYIQGFQIEYQTTKKKQEEEDFEKNNVTDYAKKLVKDAKKGDGTSNKKLDSPSEANKLRYIIEHSDEYGLNADDVTYIRNELVKAGYPADKPNTVELNNPNSIEPEKSSSAAPTQEGKQEEVKPQAEAKPQKDEVKPQKEVGQQNEEVNNAPGRKPVNEDKPNISRKPIKRPKEKPVGKKPAPDTNAKTKQKYEINLDDERKGNSLAESLYMEIHKTVSSNSTISGLIMKVNSKNAYSFVTKSHQIEGCKINNTLQKPVDLFDKIGYSDHVRILKALYQQAKDVAAAKGEKLTAQFAKNIEDEIAYGARRGKKNDPEKEDIARLNRCMDSLCKYISQNIGK